MRTIDATIGRDPDGGWTCQTVSRKPMPITGRGDDMAGAIMDFIRHYKERAAAWDRAHGG